MTREQLQTRHERVEQEPFIIRQTEEGFSIYSAWNRRNTYVVGGSLSTPTCTCPDFRGHEADPDWRCKHILAVVSRMGSPTNGAEAQDRETAEERRAIQEEGSLPEPGDFPPPEDGPAQMVLKRSVSPDGRIDSLSVELTCQIDQTADHAIRNHAERALEIQAAIVGLFLDGNGNSREKARPEPRHDVPDGKTSARVVGIAGMSTRYGHRLFLNVQVNGRTLKFFGEPTKLADALQSVGYRVAPANIKEGLRFNLPCLVVTKASEDGRYLNIEQILPTNGTQLSQRNRS